MLDTSLLLGLAERSPRRYLAQALTALTVYLALRESGVVRADGGWYGDPLATPLSSLAFFVAVYIALWLWVLSRLRDAMLDALGENPVEEFRRALPGFREAAKRAAPIGLALLAVYYAGLLSAWWLADTLVALLASSSEWVKLPRLSGWRLPVASSIAAAVATVLASKSLWREISGGDSDEDRVELLRSIFSALFEPEIDNIVFQLLLPLAAIPVPMNVDNLLVFRVSAVPSQDEDRVKQVFRDGLLEAPTGAYRLEPLKDECREPPATTRLSLDGLCWYRVYLRGGEARERRIGYLAAALIAGRDSRIVRECLRRLQRQGTPRVCQHMLAGAYMVLEARPPLLYTITIGLPSIRGALHALTVAIATAL